MKIKIATLNLCNGLQQKKNLVKELITHEQIDILCMQETQINYNMDHSLLSFPGYIIETEKTRSHLGAECTIIIESCTQEDRTWRVKTLIW